MGSQSPIVLEVQRRQWSSAAFAMGSRSILIVVTITRMEEKMVEAISMKMV